MTIQELFIRSNHELQLVIDQIGDDQWQIELPAGMTRQPATLQQAVNYHAYDDAWVPDVLAGKTKAEVGDTYDVVLQAMDTRTAYTKYNLRAIEAVRSYTDLDKITHLSYGDFSARDYLQHITSFRAFRVYDIAKLIGLNSNMAEDYVQALWDEFSPVMEAYRMMGVFPPAVHVSADASLQTRLLALAGRS